MHVDVGAGSWHTERFCWFGGILSDWNLGRMNELNQRVSRLLVAVAKGKARQGGSPMLQDASGCFRIV